VIFFISRKKEITCRLPLNDQTVEGWLLLKRFQDQGK
jgi:hypothetical protein